MKILIIIIIIIMKCNINNVMIMCENDNVIIL